MKNKFIAYIIAAFVLILAIRQTFAASPSEANRISYPVRVAVVTDATELRLSIQGECYIYTLPLLSEISKSSGLNNVTIKPVYSGLILGNEEFKIYGVKIVARAGSDIVINGRKFRGEMDIIRTEALRLLAINHLDIEDYVSGVLYHEVSHWWPMETLKAQAIAARTFAIFRSMESKNKDYDLTSDVYSQVYGGKSSERFRTSRAVEETKGEILIFKNKILPAYYHATCGGHTEDANELWNTRLTPLRGRACSYCKNSPHYQWEAEMSLQDIEQSLKSSGYKIKGVKTIEVLSRNESGRAKVIAVVDLLGTEKIAANKFRLV